MVSKVAVIALVAIVACPILLGYAMNLSETTETDYKIADDSVNVTPLLQNDVKYTSVFADQNTINSNISYTTDPDGTSTIHSIIPIYEKTSSAASSIPLSKNMASFAPGAGGNDSLAPFNSYYIIWDNGYNVGYTQMTIYSGSTPVATLTQVKEIYYDYTSDSITYVYGPSNLVNTISGGNYTSWQWSNNSGVTLHCIYGSQLKSNNNKYVDISAGFHLEDHLGGLNEPSIILPDKTKSFIMTVNLDSITDSSYSCTINVAPSMIINNGIKLVKTTTDGVVTWQYYRGSTLMADLYYDSNRNDNTYQIVVTLSDPYQYGSNNYRQDTHYELRYVGGWPSMIGEANAYATYSYDGGMIRVNTLPVITGMKNIFFSSLSNNRTPVVRMDSARIDGFEVNVIHDETYTPVNLRTNPATTLENITLYGKSIIFGGNSYSVDTDGNITIGTHKIPLKGIVFDSIPVSGGYENRINKTVISTTVQPSDITFIGDWNASVTTASMEAYTYTHTEWTPGHFGWDGMDHNFLIVGLLTSFGAFIALGIYMRRTKASLWPLLIVCGGAAVLFFIML